MFALARQEIIGLHLDSDQLHYVCLKWTGTGWDLNRPIPALEPLGSVREPAPWSLKQFLEWQTVLPLVNGASSQKKRVIYLTLPRDCFTARDLQLPPMPLEDALASVENSLPVCCHLSMDEVYYDIHLCRSTNGNMNALIIYAPRKDMDIYLDIFQETGHMDSLGGIFPLSFGIGAWLNIQHYPMPMGLILPQGEVSELAVYQQKGCLFSALWQASEGETGRDQLSASAMSKFHCLDENIFYLNQQGSPALPKPLPNRLNRLPLITENPAIAAVAPVISGQQEISIDENVTRLKTFQPLRLAVPVVLILILVISLMTWHVKREIAGHKDSIHRVETEINTLKQKLEPMEKDRKAYRKADQFLEDAHAFMKTRPRMFSHLNEMVQYLPDETWFSRLSYKNGLMIMKCESADALSVIEALRTSGMFAKVNLKGTVNRSNTGLERFSISIKLKDNEADK